MRRLSPSPENSLHTGCTSERRSRATGNFARCARAHSSSRGKPPLAHCCTILTKMRSISSTFMSRVMMIVVVHDAAFLPLAARIAGWAVSRVANTLHSAEETRALQRMMCVESALRGADRRKHDGNVRYRRQQWRPVRSCYINFRKGLLWLRSIPYARAQRGVWKPMGGSSNLDMEIWDS